MLCSSRRLLAHRVGTATPRCARAFQTTPSMCKAPHGLSDEAIASKANMQPIAAIGKAKFNMGEDDLELYGKYKAKIPFSFIDSLSEKPNGKLILTTAMSPTRFGEGKTCTSVGLSDGLCHIGKNAMVSLREPSLGPVFGVKGGAAGGGMAQVVPMTDINLHFTGDMHAIGAANNLLAALIDNHLHWNKEPILDVNRIGWRRVVDMNDRALRNITVGLGARGDGIPRSDGFDITVASEIMAIFCLSTDLKDLTRRLGQIVVGYTRANKPVTATDLCAEGALSALLRDALAPNMVQTLENNPAIIHGGPFANIAHGCSSVISTKTSLKLADYVVTEGGFGADLGAEKFFNIKCRKSGLRPDCVVVIATVRALKFHGGADEKTLQQEPSVEAVKSGIHSNLKRHLENIQKFGVPAVVAVNKFPTDTPEELATVLSECEALGFTAVLADHHNDGGAGAADLAQTVADTIDEKESDFKFLYPDDMPLTEKVRTIAREIYGASDIAIDSAAATKFKKITNDGYGDFPVCMAKTQYSFSADPTVRGAPTGHVLPIKDVRLSAGAEFVVVLTGAIMQMPGLPKLPASEKVGVGEDGEIYGLF